MVKVGDYMSCSFCQKSHEGDKLFDTKNSYSNERYLTCVGDHLRLWKTYGYLGCYEIKYCPMCGRNLNDKKRMKFRIVKYYERYKAQVYVKERWVDIGLPTGYHNIESAKDYCGTYKQSIEDPIVEEFEL